MYYHYFESAYTKRGKKVMFPKTILMRN